MFGPYTAYRQRVRQGQPAFLFPGFGGGLTWSEFSSPVCRPRWFAQVQLVCFMLAMGAALTGDDFVAVFRRPRSFVSAILVQLLVLPLLAVVIDRVAELPEGIAVGLVLVAALPGGALSKVFSYV